MPPRTWMPGPLSAKSKDSVGRNFSRSSCATRIGLPDDLGAFLGKSTFLEGTVVDAKDILMPQDFANLECLPIVPHSGVHAWTLHRILSRHAGDALCYLCPIALGRAEF